jgi:hypothetical protein
VNTDSSREGTVIRIRRQPYLNQALRGRIWGSSRPIGQRTIQISMRSSIRGTCTKRRIPSCTISGFFNTSVLFVVYKHLAGFTLVSILQYNKPYNSGYGGVGILIISCVLVTFCLIGASFSFASANISSGSLHECQVLKSGYATGLSSTQ